MYIICRCCPTLTSLRAPCRGNSGDKLLVPEVWPLAGPVNGVLERAGHTEVVLWRREEHHVSLLHLR